MPCRPHTPAGSVCRRGWTCPSYSRGLGGLGLPGDLSSQSRFVRAAFVRMNAQIRQQRGRECHQFFHILHSVDSSAAAVSWTAASMRSPLYTSCCNADKGIYYYTTYGNHQITCCGYAPGKPGQHQADPLSAGAGRTNCAAKLILRTKREKSAWQRTGIYAILYGA